MATQQQHEFVRTIGDGELLERGLHHLQVGEWQAAIACLSELTRRHPEDQRYQELLSEARLKARLRERPPRKRSSSVARSRRVWGLIIVNLVLWLAMIGQSLYWQQVQPALARSRALATQRALIERGKQALIQGDLAVARSAFQEVLRQDPGNLIARRALADIEKRQRLEERYTQARTLVAEERWEEALDLFQQIRDEVPGYRDVEAEIERVRRLQRYASILENAERLFRAGLWNQAIEEFDRLRRMAPDFKADLVASRLFVLYMDQARALLDAEPRDPDREETELRSALKWLGRALEVRPEDPEATLQQRLVRDYLQGLVAYRQASWETVIIRLNNVYTEAPDYRAGRAASLLQEAYVQAGLHHLQNGRLDRALERFRQAIAIGLQGYARPVPSQVSSLLVRADKLAEQRRAGRAVALYGEILGMMGFDDVVSLLASNVTEMPEAWRQRLLCPVPADDGGCTDLLAWRRALQEGNLQIAEPSEKQPGETAAVEAQVYVVRPGDTLIEIALQFDTTIRALVEANPIIKDPWLIRPGWQLVIPSNGNQ